MQDADLDPWSCTPCVKPTSVQLPTLKDLYGWKEVCAHCDKAGVYVTSISKQRPDQYIPPAPPLSPVLSNKAPTSPYTPFSDYAPGAASIHHFRALCAGASGG